MTSNKKLFLASQSPRRRELLSQVGFSFTVISVDIDESVKTDELAENYVIRLAQEKAIAGLNTLTSSQNIVLGSDTLVVISGEILGKPKNHDDARRMLHLLSGQTHQVMTAVSLATKQTPSSEAELNTQISVSNVSFKNITETEIEKYVATKECDDKAGSYAIQGLAAAFITHLSGSYSGVMGLPLYETVKLLEKAGITTESLVVS
ncbi:MAG: Maf family protein [Woeseiaceae bacterium]